MCLHLTPATSPSPPSFFPLHRELFDIINLYNFQMRYFQSLMCHSPRRLRARFWVFICIGRICLAMLCTLSLDCTGLLLAKQIGTLSFIVLIVRTRQGTATMHFAHAAPTSRSTASDSADMSSVSFACDSLASDGNRADDDNADDDDDAE